MKIIILVVPICFIFDNILIYHLLPMPVDIFLKFVYWNQVLLVLFVEFPYVLSPYRL